VEGGKKMENVENYDEKKQVREREGERKRERGRARERERRGWWGDGGVQVKPYLGLSHFSVPTRCFLHSHPQVVLTLIT
jgi:hypothetical protein